MKHLLTLLLFISTSVMADVCNVGIYIPTTDKYLDELIKNVKDAKCKDGDVLNLDIGFADDNAQVSKYIIFESQARYCNFDKTISFDLTGLNYNLACSFHRN